MLTSPKNNQFTYTTARGKILYLFSKSAQLQDGTTRKTYFLRGTTIDVDPGSVRESCLPKGYEIHETAQVNRAHVAPVKAST